MQTRMVSDKRLRVPPQIIARIIAHVVGLHVRFDLGLRAVEQCSGILGDSRQSRRDKRAAMSIWSS